MATMQAIGKLGDGAKDTRRVRGGRRLALAAVGHRCPNHKIRAPRQGRGRRLEHFYGPSVEQQWIARNGAQYKGEWIALDGDRLVDHEPNAIEVYGRARAQGVISPYLIQIPSKEDLPFGGW
jgi:hypothetical protein